MQFITTNLGAAVRQHTHQGSEYLIAPVVAVQEMVLNGELLPASEISAFIEAWNGIPIPINHPVQDGQYISANNPDISHVGRFWHARMDGKQLKGEMWFDLAALKQAGETGAHIRTQLENGEIINVSTAYFRTVDPQEGVHDGTRYSGIQRNLRPDHLAVLPNEDGACSIKDGCGVPRINSIDLPKGGTMEKKNKITLLQQFGNMLGFSINVAEQKDKDKDKGEDKITVELTEIKPAEDVDPQDAAGDSDPTEQPTKTQDTPQGTQTEQVEIVKLSKLVENMAAQIETLNKTVNILAANAKSQADNEKAQLVASLAANRLCPLDESDLQELPLAVLEKLGSKYTVADYSGRGLPYPITNADKDAIAIPAPILFQTPEKKEA
ncbi:MAG: DUF2213 domain-containing protein [Anaerolineae bacterium]|nr:DUF2213 domain-containing protein [Anaerolineae bacterium]